MPPHRSKAPWLFALGSGVFLLASLLDFALPSMRTDPGTRHHYMRATVDLLLGVYCGIIALRIRAKENRMARQ
jgi:hypothetical protein